MKKGFTLIELLAVILVLGVIALIAIPAVNNIINEAKKDSAKVSAANYVNAINDKVALNKLKAENVIADGEYTVEQLVSYDVRLSGETPTSGNVAIENGKVVSCSLTLGEYIITCNNNTIVVDKIEKSSPILVIDNNSNGKADTNDKVCIGSECFYVISNDNTNVRMLAEWNLNVGYDVDFLGEGNAVGIIGYDPQYEGYIMTNYTYTKLNPSIIKQDSTKKGWVSKKVSRGITSFAKFPSNDYDNDIYDLYWSNNDNLLSKYGSSYPAYVYDSNSNLYPYINSYVGILKGMTGLTNLSGNLITYDELISLGCDDSGDCDMAPSYLTQTGYWTGTAYDYGEVYIVDSSGIYSYYANEFDEFGVRPVITIPTSSIN